SCGNASAYSNTRSSGSKRIPAICGARSRSTAPMASKSIAALLRNDSPRSKSRISSSRACSNRGAAVRRRVLYTEERVRALFARTRAELDEMSERHAAEAARLRHELEECRADLAELRAAVLARQRSEQEVSELRRRRDAIIEAFAADLVPGQRLQ